MRYINFKRTDSSIINIFSILMISVFLVSIVGCEKDTSINSIVSNDGLQARLAYTDKGFTEIEVSPIIKTMCYFSDWDKNVMTPVSGLFEYYDTNGNWVATIDFGDSTCDEWATKTWNVDVFTDFCKSSNKLQFTKIEEKKMDGSEVSSSLIRDFLRDGKIEKANKILTRKWTVIRRVLKGEKKAREIGFKTANMRVSSYCEMCYGVYAVLVQLPKEISNKKFYGIANYGVKPTFMKKTPILEVHIFKFDEEIYGKKIKVSFLKFIRKEKRFESVEKLKDQIIKDIKLVKKNGIFKNN